MSGPETLLDLSTINELKDILEDDLSDIFEEFRTGTKKMIDDIRTEQQAGNFDAVIQLAHTIKGSTGNLGLKEISELTSTLENNLRQNKDTDITTFISKIESTYDETIKELIRLNFLPE
ncbi:MAG: Hpt domain-containing protein [Gammaproteobacteria bacterium]|nr:Hpt domain-containing protein [Gammaproteobacteria bacterium]